MHKHPSMLETPVCLFLFTCNLFCTHYTHTTCIHDSLYSKVPSCGYWHKQIVNPKANSSNSSSSSRQRWKKLSSGWLTTNVCGKVVTKTQAIRTHLKTGFRYAFHTRSMMSKSMHTVNEKKIWGEIDESQQFDSVWSRMAGLFPVCWTELTATWKIHRFEWKILSIPIL